MQGWIGHSKKRKAGLAMLAVLAVFFLYAGIKSLPGRLISPFHLLPPGASGVDLNKEAKDKQATEELKIKDTDGDGLSDYDELIVYKTSPYLEDTDSDGFIDKQEIASGNDPNCPVGRDCLAAAGGLPSSTDISQENLGKDLLSGSGASGVANTGGTTDWSLLQNFDLTPVQLRELLKQNGFSEDELKKIDDATLKEIWQSTLKGAPASNLPNVANDVQTPHPNPLPQGERGSEGVKPPTAAELREMLVDAGLNQQILEQLSDDELLKMYEEIIKK
ncbi:MAG: hypothetical protein Q8M83_00670 [bacterium]|nr:hypothetical protein [bacterium]